MSGAIDAKVDYQGWYTALLRPQFPELTDYHIHVAWKSEDDETRLQVDYHFGPHQSKAKHDAPFAEDFVEWVGRFISSESVNAHIHAEFEYSLEKWQSKILALPLRVPFGDKMADISGLEIKLPSDPEGARSIWLMSRKSMLDIQVAANRNVVFRGFKAQNDVDALASVASSVIVERQI